MLTDDGKHLYVSWDEYHMLIERLALKVAHSGWEFDQILCLARGGMRPGDVLMVGTDCLDDGTRPRTRAGDSVEITATGSAPLVNHFIQEAA